MKQLRVALVAGTLGRGGAEQQLLHMVAALTEAGVDTRVYCLTRGELHEGALAVLGARLTWIGQSTLPAARVTVLAAALFGFRPHVVQAAHFFVNLYATIAGRTHGAAAIGAIRSDLDYEFLTLGRWARPLLAAPPDLITNSWRARRAAVARGRNPSTVHVVPNAISLSAYGPRPHMPAPEPSLGPGPVAIVVGSLSPVKRVDRFLRALALARQQHAGLRGLIVGEGPERARLEALAGSLGLGAADVHFAGARDDVPALLSRAAFLTLSSDHEGFPNAVLEAMAARCPILATPCGDVPLLVRDGVSGFMVPFEAGTTMADRMVRLALDTELRQRLGEAARMVAEQYDLAALGDRLLATYRAISGRLARRQLAEVLS